MQSTSGRRSLELKILLRGMSNNNIPELAYRYMDSRNSDKSPIGEIIVDI